MAENVGYQVRTDDGIIGTSGTAKVIYGFSIVNDGTGANTVAIYDGTSTGGTKVFSQTCAQGVNQTVSLHGSGVVLKNGCFVDVDAKTTQVTVFYKELA